MYNRSTFSLLFSLCACVYSCVYSYVCRYTFVCGGYVTCVQVEAKDQPPVPLQRCPPSISFSVSSRVCLPLCLIFVSVFVCLFSLSRQALRMTWHSLVMPGCWPRASQIYMLLPLQWWDYKCEPPPLAFYVSSGDQTQFLLPIKQAFGLLRHFPNSVPFPF